MDRPILHGSDKQDERLKSIAAFEELRTLLCQKIAEGLAGGVSTKSVEAIVDEELGPDGGA